MSSVETFLPWIGLIAQTVGLAFVYGKLTERVHLQAARIDDLSSQHRQIQGALADHKIEAQKTTKELLEDERDRRDLAIRNHKQDCSSACTARDNSFDVRVDRLEERVDSLEEKIGERFDKFADEIRGIVSGFTHGMNELSKRVQHMEDTKMSAPRMAAVVPQATAPQPAYAIVPPARQVGKEP